MPTPVLYCCDPLDPRRTDGHFAAEAHEVRARGGQVALIDHDALLSGDAERAVARVPAGLGLVRYRGWMIPAERYGRLGTALARRGARLLTDPEQYRSAHELPGWYAAFADLTPPGGWLPAAPGEVPETGRLEALAGRLPPGPGIVKDYVKSRKHEWDQACYVPELADGAVLARVVRRFVELQGDFLAGGVVLRAWEPFVRNPSVASEVRVWWLDGEPRLLTPHPDGPAALGEVPDLEGIGAAVRRLGCPFVTTDVALRTDGWWRVVEVGDAQVSDLHRESDRGEFAALLSGS